VPDEDHLLVAAPTEDDVGDNDVGICVGIWYWAISIVIHWTQLKPDIFRAGRRRPGTMRDGVLLFVVGVILIGGILLWRAHVDPFDPLRVQNVRVSESVDAAQPAPVSSHRTVKPAQVAKSVPPPVAENLVVVESAPARQTPPPTPVVVRDPPPFPAADEIAIGVRPDTVTTKYGDPAISAVTSTGGHMVETFVYARDRGRSATVIRLEDGRVSSAFTSTAPPHAAGMSIPRHL
jgi:hypothetical protein